MVSGLALQADWRTGSIPSFSTLQLNKPRAVVDAEAIVTDGAAVRGRYAVRFLARVAEWC